MSEGLLILVAIIPIAWLFAGLCVLRIAGHIVCPVALVLTAAAAALFYGMDGGEIATAAAEGALFACWPVLLVILTAMTMYRYSVATGGMDRILQILSGVSTDKRVLVLIVAWGFGGFLEAVAGFGTPILIPGSLLVALGFAPVLAVIVCLAANTAAVPFAGLGLPVETIANVSGLEVAGIGQDLAIQLFVPSILLPFLLVIFTGRSVRAVKGVFLVTLISGVSFAGPLLLLALVAGPSLPTLTGSICSIFATALAGKKLCRDTEESRRYRVEAPAAPQRLGAAGAGSGGSGGAPLSPVQAFLPYLMILLVVCAFNLVAPVHEALASLKTSFLIYSGEDAAPLTFSWALAPCMMLIIAALLACGVQRYSFVRFFGFAKASFLASGKMIVTIISIVALAKIMNYATMTDEIAKGLVAAFGGMYPLVAPLVGAFGVFITGSDTTCAVLFGSLQQQAAARLGADPYWIVASNLSGASMGKMISLQSVIVGAGIDESIAGKEGDILKKMLPVGLAASVFVGLIVYIGYRIL
ncbi:MAG: L-lactate permease [Clostridiales Family XIII bacterium]|jgi:lactate permease|nr:L-lactate permease [Clostridiales Family XIII bacterium]